MLYNKITKLLIGLLFAIAVIPGCTKDKELAVETGNGMRSLQDFINTEDNISIFRAAFIRAGMQEDSAWLSGGPYTYFIPIDSAFTAQALPLAVVNTMDKEALKKMLKYMIVKGRISSATLAGFFRQTAATLSPERPILTKNYYGIYFNGIAIQQANINLGDAVVHKMKKVAFPPVSSANEVIAAAPELSIFNAIVVRAYNSGPNYGATIKNMFETNGKTIFAPTNAAFVRYGIPSVDSVNRIQDTVTLAALVRGQTFIGTFNNQGIFYDNQAWSCTISDFKGGYSLAGMNANSVSVREDGLTIKAPLNYPDIKIVKTDMLAYNGVIHEIDQVILK